MTQNEHVYAICCRLEVPCDVISTENEKTVTDYFLFAVIEVQETVENARKCRIQRLRCRLSCEPFELESSNFTNTCVPTCTTSLLDMTSLIASGQLQNAIKYCTKVTRKTVLSVKRVKQEKPTNCGTKAADVLANFVAGKL